MVKQLSNVDFQNAGKVINLPTPTNGGDAATKAYVDGLISTAMKPPSGLDCSTNPNYPASTAGDQFRVTSAGKIGGANGLLVEIGDTIACQTTTVAGDHATVGNSFYILQTNIDKATNSTVGYIQLATQSEVNTGTDAEKAVTSATLQTKLNNTLTSTTYTTQVGDGTNTNFTITHSLATQNVFVYVRQSSSPFSQVGVDISFNDANNITVERFVNPPTTNQYSVIVKK